MSGLIDKNNAVFPVVPEPTNISSLNQNTPPALIQPKKVAKKSNKIKIIAIVSIIAVVLIIIIVVAVVLAVLRNI